MRRVFLRKDRCFEGHNFFHHNNWIVATDFWRFSEIFPGFSNNVFIHYLFHKSNERSSVIWRVLAGLSKNYLSCRGTSEEKYIFLSKAHSPEQVFWDSRRKTLFSSEVFQHCCRNRNLLLQRKSLDERFFSRKKLFLWRLSVFGGIFLETWRSFFFKVNKIAFYMSRKSLRIKRIFW